MQVIERTFSEFLRHPKEVVAELANSDVVLRRRNAPALRLCRVDRENARDEVFGSVARMLRNLAANHPAALEEVFSDAYPWVKFLPPDERELFAVDLTKQLLAVNSIGDFAPVGLLVDAWKATAEVHASPELSRRLSGPFEVTHGGRVPRPAL